MAIANLGDRKYQLSNKMHSVCFQFIHNSTDSQRVEVIDTFKLNYPLIGVEGIENPCWRTQPDRLCTVVTKSIEESDLVVARLEELIGIDVNSIKINIK